MKSLLFTFLCFSHNLLLFFLCIPVPLLHALGPQKVEPHELKLRFGRPVPARSDFRVFVFPKSYSKEVKARSESLAIIYERRVRNIISGVAADPRRNISGW